MVNTNTIPQQPFAPLIVDAHQDLAWNILTFGRDYTRSAEETRHLERNTPTPAHNDDTMLGWPDFQRGKVAVIFASLYNTPARAATGVWDHLCYKDIQEAHRLYREQVDIYHRLQDQQPEKFRLIKYQRDLQEILADWRDPLKVSHPVGLVMLMEGAEGVRSPEELESWWEWGLRILGPAWIGTRFCGGTHEPGPLTEEGFALLEGMVAFGFTLDISHMDTKASLQALDVYPGRIIASHANAAALLKGDESNRHLTDEVIHKLIEREGIIGITFFNRFLNPEWRSGEDRQQVGLHHIVNQIDYICQFAGDALHTGMGSDLDGGFGLRGSPDQLETIADLRKIIPLLSAKGYTEDDIATIMGENWLNHLRVTLPEDL
jgi:membrane dipeptidase